MKFFTPDWWASGCETPDDVFERYQQYKTSVRHLLPGATLNFDENHTLHDSRLNQVAANFADRRVQLTLLGWDTGFSKKTRYRLTFAGVELFEQYLPNDQFGESELGDLGYWEWEALSDSTEIRLLFASSAMFRLVFRNFSYTFEVA